MKPASSHFWCAAALSALVLGFYPATAQEASQEANSPNAGQNPAPGGKAKSEKKLKSEKKATSKQPHDSGADNKNPSDKNPSDKSAKSAKAKLKTGQFASEADAKDQCPGPVVWIDSHQLNHYEGSREYGKKPGAFACEP